MRECKARAARPPRTERVQRAKTSTSGDLRIVQLKLRSEELEMMRRLFKVKTAYLLLSLFGLSESAFADSLPYGDLEPHVTSSPTGRFYFKMVPKNPWEPEHDGTGFLYKVEEGEDALLYQTQGWFAYGVVLSIDGQHLVRFNNPVASPPSPGERIVLGFYHRGKLRKEYSVADLSSDLSDTERSTDYYRYFIKEVARAPSSLPAQIRVETIDGAVMFFDIKTGERGADTSPP